MYDVAIIGGGPAGLAAALGLSRARKRVVLFDGGVPRNGAAAEVHGYVTQDGVPPAEMRRRGHAELAAYATCELRMDERVDAIQGERGAFTLAVAGGSVGARRILLATGIIDELPALPGYRELWGQDVIQCPYCHGYELRDRTFGYLAPDDTCLEWAVLLRAWTSDLVVFTSGAFTVPAATRADLARAKIRIEERGVVGLRSAGGRLAAIELAGGAEVTRQVLFAHPPQRVPQLCAALELACEAPSRLVMVAHQTSRPGIYAAGDLAAHEHGALAAAASGAAAAHALDAELTRALVMGTEGARDAGGGSSRQ